MKVFRNKSTGDLEFHSECGCVITYFASANFKSSRMTPGTSCNRHVGRDQTAARNDLRYEADRELRHALNPNLFRFL